MPIVTYRYCLFVFSVGNKYLFILFIYFILPAFFYQAETEDFSLLLSPPVSPPCSSQESSSCHLSSNLTRVTKTRLRTLPASRITPPETLPTSISEKPEEEEEELGRLSPGIARYPRRQAASKKAPADPVLPPTVEGVQVGSVHRWNNNKMLPRMRQPFVDASILSTPTFYRREYFVGANILSARVKKERTFIFSIQLAKYMTDCLMRPS
jgi:hypothetical protein